MLDILAEFGLAWFYGKVERRYGCVVAWLATIALVGAIVAIIVAVFVVIFPGR